MLSPQFNSITSKEPPGKLLKEIFYVAIQSSESAARIQAIFWNRSIPLYHLALVKEGEQPHGHVTPTSVLRSYRRLGIAKKLMLQSQESMATIYRASHESLHVRKSNRAALSLYRDTLDFEVQGIEQKYYAHGEAAYSLRLMLKHE
ncbi:hypothetical protein C8R42DRAFT_676949 [Lentinula raphanica]|nr:hypothetical protein C8R42DRAFT_676949 [Lentinula raphanica]